LHYSINLVKKIEYCKGFDGLLISEKLVSRKLLKKSKIREQNLTIEVFIYSLTANDKISILVMDNLNSFSIQSTSSFLKN